jgi:ribonuclease HII
MAWLIGIDEAGYGPNLGPFVMSAVAFRVPEALVGVDLWQVLRDGVRRQGGQADERIVVDDSKAVHGAGGLPALEANVVPTVAPWLTSAATLADHVDRVCPTSRGGLCGESWYRGKTTLPASPTDDLAGRIERFHACCERAGIRRESIRSVAICAPRFNAILDQHGSKGGVLAEALTELLRGFYGELDGEPWHVFIDKHGGRNTYAAMLQHALPEGMVIARQESAARSQYEVSGAARPIRITFQPRADSEHFGVALASMASKYLRELFMLEFNRFWQEHVPGLAPTAGYPSDATRFLQAIRPALQKLALEESAVWRRK